MVKSSIKFRPLNFDKCMVKSSIKFRPLNFDLVARNSNRINPHFMNNDNATSKENDWELVTKHTRPFSLKSYTVTLSNRFSPLEQNGYETNRCTDKHSNRTQNIGKRYTSDTICNLKSKSGKRKIQVNMTGCDLICKQSKDKPGGSTCTPGGTFPQKTKFGCDTNMNETNGIHETIPKRVKICAITKKNVMHSVKPTKVKVIVKAQPAKYKVGCELRIKGRPPRDTVPTRCKIGNSINKAATTSSSGKPCSSRKYGTCYSTTPPGVNVGIIPTKTMIGGATNNTSNIPSAYATRATNNRINIKHGCRLKCGTVNARSVINKSDLIFDYMRQHSLDIYMIVEAWCDPQNPENMKVVSNIKGSTYNIKLAPRIGRTGGGILVAYKQNLKVEKMKPPKMQTCEIMEIRVQDKRKKIRFVIIYRPESDTEKNPYTMTECYKEFTELFAYYKSLKEEVIFCGDYNFHMNKPDNNKAQKFKEILDTFELIQHINESTHNKGNTLDLIISNKDSSIISHQVDLMISDHCNILFDVDMSKPPRMKKNITYRKTKSININNFKTDVRNSMTKINMNDDLNNLVNSYQTNLREVKTDMLQNKQS